MRTSILPGLVFCHSEARSAEESPLRGGRFLAFGSE